MSDNGGVSMLKSGVDCVYVSGVSVLGSGVDCKQLMRLMHSMVDICVRAASIICNGYQGSSVLSVCR